MLPSSQALREPGGGTGPDQWPYRWDGGADEGMVPSHSRVPGGAVELRGWGMNWGPIPIGHPEGLHICTNSRIGPLVSYTRDSVANHFWKEWIKQLYIT